MKRKIVSIFFCMLLITTSLVIISNKKIVQAEESWDNQAEMELRGETVYQLLKRDWRP